MSSTRLAPPAGTHIDRGRTVLFEFNGQRLNGFEGDTLASALLANNIQLLGRSFKLHRPRGIFSCGIEEPSAIVDVIDDGQRTPNVRATVIEAKSGLIAESVNCWPNVRFDAGAINSWFAAGLPAGFYYKTFKWPNWQVFEPSIRRMAGLGRVAQERDRDRYEEINVSEDVLVVGAGPAGLSAAVAAAQAGAAVTLISISSRLGGSLGWRNDLMTESLIAKAMHLGIRILRHTVAFGVYDHNLLAARQELGPDARGPSRGGGILRERLWKIRARKIVAATGAFERPMVFPDNDRPGVMLAGAAAKFAGAFGVACGKRVVITANSDSAYYVARQLRDAGMTVAQIIDCRSESVVDRESASSVADIPIHFNSVIVEVKGCHGVRGCTIASVGADKRPHSIKCDAILAAGGFAPAVHLHSQAGGKLRWLDESSMFVPEESLPDVISVGACAGVFSRDRAVEHAEQVGTALARRTVIPEAPISGAGNSLANTHVVRKGSKQFIDLQNDVTVDDVGLSARENYRSVEHLKRYTTTGMGTDQGKTSNINALVLLAAATQRAPAAVGTTKFRPPFTPITMGTYAGRRVGRLLRPIKRLPAEGWHQGRGAAFEEYGGWWRPAAYPNPGETIASAAEREAKVTRSGAGIFDGSPLGKLLIAGPDAARFLDLMYVGTISSLSLGQARYGILLNENGILVDDGIVARLDEDRFWVNTSSGGAERTAAAFEEWLQCEFVDLKVLVTSVTSRWANVTVAGPRAWDWLDAAGFASELSPAHTQHMSMHEGRLDGMPIHVLRASFSGELGYEINVPANHGTRLFERLERHASQFAAAPYGVEALQIMRVEKGYIHIGTDTDGTTFPGDIGLGRAVGRKAANFVGRRSIGRPVAIDPNRLQLVGLIATDKVSDLPVGAHIAQHKPPTTSEGHVTSSVASPALGHRIALAMLARGSTRLGERVHVHHLGTIVEAEVVKLPFVDPTGKRVHG